MGRYEQTRGSGNDKERERERERDVGTSCPFSESTYHHEVLPTAIINGKGRENLKDWHSSFEYSVIAVVEAFLDRVLSVQRGPMRKRLHNLQLGCCLSQACRRVLANSVPLESLKPLELVHLDLPLGHHSDEKGTGRRNVLRSANRLLIDEQVSSSSTLPPFPCVHPHLCCLILVSLNFLHTSDFSTSDFVAVACVSIRFAGRLRYPFTLLSLVRFSCLHHRPLKFTMLSEPLC